MREISEWAELDEAQRAFETALSAVLDESHAPRERLPRG